MKRDHLSPLQRHRQTQLEAADALVRNYSGTDLENLPPALRNTLAAFVVAHCTYRQAHQVTSRLPNTEWRRF